MIKYLSLYERMKSDCSCAMSSKSIIKHLVETAQRAGVETTLDFAVFQNHGYKGLYGGLDQKAIHERKGLKKSQKILDYMGSTEPRPTCFVLPKRKKNYVGTRLIRSNLANKTHYDVGQKSTPDY